MSAREQTMVVTLQGLVNKTGPIIWYQTSNDMSQILRNELQSEGTTIHTESNPWLLMNQFRSHVQRIIIYKTGTESLNAATSLCGPMRGVAVEESLQLLAVVNGFTQMFDARSLGDESTWTTYQSQFTTGSACEQGGWFNIQLRDWAVQNNMYTFFKGAGENSFRRSVAQALGPAALFYGWTGDEYAWIKDLSSSQAGGVPADFSLNLSAVSRATVPIPSRPHKYPAPAEPGQRIIAFVTTDGDNVQYMNGGFVTDPGMWASPHRGTFNMTWEMPASFGTLAPRTLRYFYNRASNGTYLDDFVCGPSGSSYAFPTHRTDRAGFAAQTAQMLEASRMSIVSVLDDPTSSGQMANTAELLERPEVLGVLYKAYSPYHKYRNRIYWKNGKPAMSYTYILWNEATQPSWGISGVASSINAMPSSPTTDPKSYALVNVHAWSWGSVGGPMSATKQVIDQLAPGTRVVTAEQLLVLLRNNFGEPVLPEQVPVELSTWHLD